MSVTKKDNTMKTRWMTPNSAERRKKKKEDGKEVAVSSTLLVVDKKEQRVHGHWPAQPEHM